MQEDGWVVKLFVLDAASDCEWCVEALAVADVYAEMQGWTRVA